MSKFSIVGRGDWGARSSRGGMAYQSRRTEAFLHHTVNPDAERMTTGKAQRQAMRGIQNFHMDSRGWADIGYHFIVFQAFGKMRRDNGGPGTMVYRARPLRYVPAAQAGHNTGTLAVSVYGNLDTEPLLPETRDTIARLLKRYPSLVTLGGHGSVYPTSCPGKNGRAAVPAIARAAGLRVYH